MSIKEWLGPPPSKFTQHKAAFWFLQAQVRWRWGAKIACEFNPLTDVKTFIQWRFLSRRAVMLGQKALRGVTLVPIVEDGKMTTKHRVKVIHLFHIRQTTRR